MAKKPDDQEWVGLSPHQERQIKADVRHVHREDSRDCPFLKVSDQSPLWWQSPLRFLQHVGKVCHGG
jgi:hypothetical protein